MARLPEAGSHRIAHIAASGGAFKRMARPPAVKIGPDWCRVLNLGMRACGRSAESDMLDAKTHPSAATPATSTDRMLFVPAGTFHMGSDRHYPEEAPVT